MDRNDDLRVPASVSKVALRKESVDRNQFWCQLIVRSFVALRKESVDRNIPRGILFYLLSVALRKESVDRNQSSVSLDPIVICRSPQGERV